MTGTLRQARILSSETDNTIKQEQSTNVNIKITKPNETTTQQQEILPNKISQSREIQLGTKEQPSTPRNINFTQEEIPLEEATMFTPQMGSQLAFQPQISNLSQERGIADLSNELDSLEKKNKFLQMIIEMYESNPLKINSYVVCENKLLMNMIKLLTDADKVELVLSDEVGCGCSAKVKFINVAKIMITKNGKTEDFKYSYNDLYCEFVKYGISLKMII